MFTLLLLLSAVCATLSPFVLIRQLLDNFNLNWMLRPDFSDGRLLHPDVFRDTPQLITSRGFDYEEHRIGTQHFELRLYRIVNPFNNRPDFCNNNNSQPVVLMLPGLMAKSSMFLVAADGQLRADGKYFEDGIATDCDVTNKDGSTAVLAFALASCGYDVWFGEDREVVGPPIVNQKTNQSFWDFTLADMALDDLPMMINYVLKKTNANSLNVYAFSKSALMMLIMLSEQPEMTSKIDRLFAISPPLTDKEEPGLKIFGTLFKRFPPFGFLPPFAGWRSQLFDLVTSHLLPNCDNILYRLAVKTKTAHLDRRGREILAHLFLRTSTNTIVHYRQLTKSWRFFDYGKWLNRIVYNNATENCHPPVIQLNQIRHNKIAVFYGAGDFNARPSDVDKLQSVMSVKLWRKFEMPENVFHLDYVVNQRVARMVNAEVMRLLKL